MNILTKENPQKTPKYENEDQEEAEEKKQKRSGKRGGSGSGSGNGVCCQAEECRVDLTEAKRYHRRHKVCEFHAKAHSVLVSGLTQRFCQQCSRFHELTEFDEAKRSCRRRLAGHNERRRKTSSEQQREDGSSSSRTKATATAANPQCKPADNVSHNVQMTTYPRPAATPTNYQHYEIR
ncbi:uncharacterized protein LOC141656389 [Silene latifolia]|uniref:uncharacterized protein LOC141656389 n=1 Tax=Silene latifolia TaxID=37657 RepID=UPI003D779004